MIFFLFSIFLPFLDPQKRKRQSAYDGIKYDKLGSSGDVNSIPKSPLKLKSSKLLISADDVELNHEKLQQAYDELHDNERDDDDDEESEETRFITSDSKKSSFYTSSERTWSAINPQIIL